VSGASGTPPPEAGGSDPSMEDILASIRRILNEDEAAGSPHLPDPGAPPNDNVLVLDPSMIVDDQEPADTPHPMPQSAPQPPLPTQDQPPPQHGPAMLVAPEAAASAALAVNALVKALVAERAAPVYRGGPTIEDVVRDELRPLLKAWLDQHLPPLVERLVRTEIERVVSRAAP